VLHISKDIRKSYNSHHSYRIGGVVLPVNTEFVDLGVTMDSKLRFDTHILTMVHKAHIRTALLRRCFRSRDQNLLFRAFTVYVQPLLEYCSPVWNPHYHCDIAKIESVQRRFTKHNKSIKSFTYAQRLDILCAELLELRRLKFDLIMIYCFVHGLNALEFSDFF